MAFNRVKAQESALKYLQQGKVGQAITEYLQILRQDPRDQATLMTVGDLFVRQGDTKQAIEYFEKLAQLFLKDGFNSKAIAIYKKIGKLAPAETLPLERLAELYVQQGVLSEARPLFLQLAEVYLKDNRSQQAVEVLHKLLEVEPDNPRVQSRLAELYMAMGRKREAAETYLSFARRLLERGDSAEAQKLLDKALEADPANTAAVQLKAQAVSSTEKPASAIAMLERLPDAEAGGETTSLLIDLSLKAGQMPRARELARKAFASDPKHFQLTYRVATAQLEGGEADAALELLGEIRDAMTEAGEHEPLSQALSSVAEKLPERLEPLEWLVDLYRKTSDSFRLPDAIARLADAYAGASQFEQAESLYMELLERDPENELLCQRLNQVRARMGREPIATPQAERAIESVPPPVASVDEHPLDEITQRYVTQALTDVDLFSSYGLTQKAIQLLENVRQRAPRHSPVLERLLDLHLGAGNEKRTAELAAQLEQIYRQRKDSAGAERFAELRRRFQRAAGLTAEELASATEAAEVAAPAAEFSIPAAPAAMEPATQTPAEAQSEEPPAFDLVVSEEQGAAVPVQEAAVQEPTKQEPAPVPEEVDLSDEWASLAQELDEVTQAPEPAEAVPAAADAPAEEETAKEEPGEFELELVPTTPAPETEELGAMSTDQFLNDLAAEVDGLELDAAAAQPLPAPPSTHSPGPPSPPSNSVADEGSVEQLREVFQDFRAELGEMGEEDEDLETHYNLGIAYREMGLLEEAIGEFQKVAKAVQAGRPFRYAMQCSTLLGLSFMAKGEPQIAVVWYLRALETPGLDQESILALRYDLGVAQELAGDSQAALESFRQVYAMNIDYRDVAERIATLQQH
jgi:tetratricopeptide (TPR) repeat protein